MEHGFRIGVWRVEPRANLVRGPRGAKRIPPKAMQVLVLLAERADEVVAREAILRLVWPVQHIGEQVLTNAIWQLRKAFEDGSRLSSIIETVPRRGYRLSASVCRDDATTGRSSALAVLPLDNLTGDDGQLYLVDGIAEALIGELVRIPGLRVIARASTMHYRNQRQPLREICDQLRVGLLVTGAVARSSERVRVTAQLVDAPSECVLWSGSFERHHDDMLQLQAELAASVVSEVGALIKQVVAGGPSAIRANVDPGVLELHLRGRYLINGPSFEEVERGLVHVREAANQAPDYAPAHADCARGCYALASWGRGPGRALLEAAQSSLDLALEADPDHVEARVWAARVRSALAWQPAEAVWDVARALEHSPRSPLVRDALAHCLAASGQLDAAIEEERKALDYDPLSPTLNTALGFFLRASGRAEEAIAQLDRTLEISPAWTIARLELGRSYLSLGDRDRAVDALSPAEPTWAEFLAHLTAGRTQAATTMLERWADEGRTGYVAPYWLAERYVWAGRFDQAMHWLERALVDHQMHLVYVAVEPTFAPLHGRAPFEKLLSRMGLQRAKRNPVRRPG